MIDFVKVGIASLVPRLPIVGLTPVLILVLVLIPLLLVLVVKMMLVLPEHQIGSQFCDSRSVLPLAKAHW
jgi:hypothetical protein